jgi:hypothetical protein
MITVIISIRDELQRSNRYFHLKYILISIIEILYRIISVIDDI